MRSSLFDGGCRRTSDGGVRFGPDVALSPQHALLVEQMILALAGQQPRIQPKKPSPWHLKRAAACQEIERRHAKSSQSYTEIVMQMYGEGEWREHFAACSRSHGPRHVVDAVLRSFYRWKRYAAAPPSGPPGPPGGTDGTTDSH